MKKFITSIVLVIPIILVFASISSATEKVTMQLRWHHNFIFAGYYAAVEKGFYNELGLNVSFIEGSATTSSVDQVLAGNAEFGTSNSKILISRFQGKPVVALATIFQHSPLVLIAQKNSNVKNLHDLVGQQVFFNKTRDVEIAASFLSEGIPFTKLKFVDRKYSIDNYFDTKISGIAAFSTNQPFFLIEKNISFTTIHPSTYGIDFYGDCLFTTEREIKKHPKRVKAFLEASLKGWEYALNNPKEIIDLLQIKYKVKESREHLRYTAAKVQELVQSDLIGIGHMNPGRWKHMADIFEKLKLIEPQYSLNGFLYNPNPERDYTWLFRLLIVTVTISILLSLITLFLVRFNRRLKVEVKERKRAEKALKESENKFSKSFYLSPDAISISSLEKGVLIDINQNFIDLFGYTQEELIGTSVLELNNWDDHRDREAMVKAIKKDGRVKMLEVKGRSKAGLSFFGEISAEVIELKGKKCLITMIRDISERKKTQEMIVQSEKMLSVGGLAAGMAHEINNPLAGVMQTAAVMENRLTKLNIPANIKTAEEIGISLDDISLFMDKRGILHMLKTINQSGQRMAEIVNNMLSFARQTEAQISTIELPGLIDKTLELAATDFDLKKHFDFKTIEIQKKYGKDVPLVPCEGAKIQQVILNILRNGAQAMQEVKTKKPIFIVGTRLEKFQKMVCIEIEDNGPGMEEKTMKRIFEPFFTTKPVGVGTGLGLSVSYFIITENHGGEMTVESTPGQGTKFIIRLPLEGKLL